MFDYSKILLAGDTHGDLSHVKYLAEIAKSKGCQAIIQVGDFGFFPNMISDFIPGVEEALKKNGLNLFFIDGNHEDFEALLSEDYSITEDGFRNVAENIFHIPRSLRWNWNGVSFLGLGGAHSIDKQVRLQREKKPRTLWFEEELITFKQFNDSVDRGETNILICHDCASSVKIPGFDQNKFSYMPEVRYSQECISNVIEQTNPFYVIHGHLHYYYGTTHKNDRTGKNALVVGLDMNGKKELSWAILDLEEFKKQFLKA